MRNRHRQKTHQADELDVTTLIDAVFMLLVYFLLTVTFGAVQSDSPDAETASRKDAANALIVTIVRSSSGDWQYRVAENPRGYFDGELRTELNSVLSADYTDTVVVRCSPRCPWPAVQAAVGIIRSVGADISVQMQVSRQQESTDAE